MKLTRKLNGYVTRYCPEHPRALSGTGYKGYVYLHILVAEKILGRPLLEQEVVHHLDGDPSNNAPENLLVLLSSQHNKLHAWISRGAPYRGRCGKKRVNSGKPNGSAVCKQCGEILSLPRAQFCSKTCSGKFNTPRKVPRPTKEELSEQIHAGISFLELGRRYGVSNNAVRKWAKQYGIPW